MSLCTTQDQSTLTSTSSAEVVVEEEELDHMAAQGMGCAASAHRTAQVLDRSDSRSSLRSWGTLVQDTALLRVRPCLWILRLRLSRCLLSQLTQPQN